MYRAFSKWEGFDEWYGPIDLMFVRWSMSSANGTVVTFQIDDEKEWAKMRESKAIDGGEGLSESPHLIELDQEGVPINVEQRAKLEKYERKKNWPKGGPQSKRAARLCNDIEFIAWVAPRIKGKMEAGSITTGAEVAEWMRQECDIDTRAQLDHDPAALVRFEENIMKPFLRSQMH